LEYLEIDRYYSVLIMLERNKGNCTQQCLCDKLKIDKASMVSIIDYLESNKLIKRKINPDDRRAYRLELTQKALTILPDLHREIDTLNKLALKGLKKSEAVFFHHALTIITDNLVIQPSASVVINFKKAKRN